MKEHDRGLIVVGGSVALGDLSEESGEDAALGGDDFYAELAAEEDEATHAAGGAVGWERLGGVSAASVRATDKSRRLATMERGCGVAAVWGSRARGD